MNTNEVEALIEDFLKRTRKALPPGKDSEDLLEDLRAHISDSLADKARTQPSASRATLVKEVLEELGDPEDIAYEFGQARVTAAKPKPTKARVLRIVGRLLVAVVVVFLAAAFVSNMTGGSVNFWNAVFVLLILAVAEWFLRGWQTESR